MLYCHYFNFNVKPHCIKNVLLTKHEERNRKEDRIFGAIDGWFVDEGGFGLGRQDLSLFFVHADVGIETHGQQSDDDIQFGIQAYLMEEEDYLIIQAVMDSYVVYIIIFWVLKNFKKYWNRLLIKLNRV